MQRKDFHTQLLKPGMKSPLALGKFLRFFTSKTTENVCNELTINQTRPPGRTA